MILQSKHKNKFTLVLLIFFLVFFLFSCKSTKKTIYTYDSKNNISIETKGVSYVIDDAFSSQKFTVSMNPFSIKTGRIGTSLLFALTSKTKEINSQKITIQRKTYSELERRQVSKIKCEIFYADNNKNLENSNIPCILFFHGGAFVFQGTQYHKKIIFDLVKKTGSIVVFVDYSLSPKYPYPYAVYEGYDVYNYIVENASEFGIDQNKIGIMGDSAGGCLASALSQKIRDDKIQQPLFEMLIYPVLSAAQDTDSMKQFTSTPRWNSKLNKTMWELYLPAFESTKDFFESGSNKTQQYKYASPFEAESLVGLPSTYIEVSEIDCLRDEGKAYAEKLRQANVPVVLYENKGAVHGFELNYDCDYTQNALNRRIDFINKLFSNSK